MEDVNAFGVLVYWSKSKLTLKLSYRYTQKANFDMLKGTDRAIYEAFRSGWTCSLFPVIYQYSRSEYCDFFHCSRENWYENDQEVPLKQAIYLFRFEEPFKVTVEGKRIYCISTIRVMNLPIHS